MANVTLRAVLTGTNAGMVRAFTEGAASAEQNSLRISQAGTKGAAAFSEAFEKHTSLVGGAFSKLGNVGSTFGLPFTDSLDKIGRKLDMAKSKGEGFGATMSAVGGVTLAAGLAGFIAFGAEAIHVADQLHTAQSGLETAVKNSGVAFAAFDPYVKKAEGSMVKLGFTNTDVVGSLATLTTATNSPLEALTKLPLAADMARIKHISLAEASGQLTKVLAGNTRVIAQWGLNLDIGSGKLHSVQAAQDALANASAHLTAVQQAVSTGHLKGAAAANQLAAAHHAVDIANRNFQQSAQAIQTVLAALEQRTHGAAAAFGDTFPGQLKRAQAEIYNTATAFGSVLVNDIQHGEVALADIIKWFEKNKTVAEALGLVVVNVLGAAVLTFTAGAVKSFVLGVGNMVGGLFGLGATSAATAVEVAGSSAAIEAGNAGLMASFATLTASVEANTAMIAAAMAAQTTEVTTASGLIIATNTAEAGSFAAVPVAATEAAGVLAVAEGGMVATTGAASAEMAVALGVGSGGLGFVLIGLAAGAEALALNWQNSWHDIKQWTIDGVNAVIDQVNRLSSVQGLLGMLHLPKLGHLADDKGPAGGWTGSYGVVGPPHVDLFGNPTVVTKEQRDLQAFLEAIHNIQGNGPSGSPGGVIPGISPAVGSAGGGSSTRKPKVDHTLDQVKAFVESATGKGTGELQSLQQAITSNSLNGLKNATTGVAATKFAELVKVLAGIHTQATDELVAQLKATYKEAQDQLAADIKVEGIKANTDLLKLHADVLADQTTAVENAARAQTQAIQDAASAMSIAVQAAAGAMSDAARTTSDRMSASAQAIIDATAMAHDDATARAQAIMDASQTVVDQIALQGLSGLNLVAQQQTVALDQLKQSTHTQIAAAQHSIDVVTTDNHATVAQAQVALDQATAIQNSLVAQAAAQNAVVQQQSNALIGAQQSQFDQVQAQTNRQVAFAADQAAYSLAKGTKAQADEAAAKEAQARAQQQLIVGQAQAALSGAQNMAANQQAQAQAALTSAQDQANSIKAAADAALQAAQGNASIVLAQAQQALSQVSDNAAIAEAQQQAIINETRAHAQQQFGGSGLVVNITGIDPSNATAIASELSWIHRTQIANAG